MNQSKENEKQLELLYNGIEPFALANYILTEDPEIIMEIYPETGTIENILKYYTYEQARERFTSYLRKLHMSEKCEKVLSRAIIRDCRTCKYCMRQDGLFKCYEVGEDFIQPVDDCNRYITKENVK